MKNSKSSNKKALTKRESKSYISSIENIEDMLGGKMKPKKKKKKNAVYINNKFFYEMLKEYKYSKSRRILNILGKEFLKMAEHIVKKPNFINYTQDRKNEMISDATFFMVKYIDTYDIKRKNPFAFFSQIAFNAFKQNINKNKKHDTTFIPLHYIENASN